MRPHSLRRIAISTRSSVVDLMARNSILCVAGRGRRPTLWHLIAFLYLCTSLSCNSGGFHAPDGRQCGMGPITPGVARPCDVVNAQCPAHRPANARTLVSMFACDFPTGTAPCANRASICPLLPDEGLSLDFRVENRDYETCASLANVVLKPSNDGGVVITWIARESVLNVDGGCTLVSQSTGNSSVTGPCCATTLDIDFPGARRTCRTTVQADWGF